MPGTHQTILFKLKKSCSLGTEDTDSPEKLLRTVLANAIGEKRRKISSTCTLAKRASPYHIAVMIIIILISYRQDFVSIAEDRFSRKFNHNSKKLNCSAIYDKKETANYDPFPKHSKTHAITPNSITNDHLCFANVEDIFSC